MAESHADVLTFPTGGVSIDCDDLRQTTSLAGIVASHLRLGDVVLLDSDLAVGKTTFVSLVCRALGCFDQPSSPTYVISNVYTCPHFEVFHIDAYRLSGIDEFLQLGLDEFFRSSLTFIEWGDRVASVFDRYLRIEIDFKGPTEDRRTYRLAGSGPHWCPLIAALAAHGPGGKETT